MNNNISLLNLVEFLESVDSDFPISLSDKVNINDYAMKLLNNATIKFCIKGNQIVGMVAGYTENLADNIAYITVLAVRKEFRGLRIGYDLVKEFIEVCRGKKIKAIHLYTHKTNSSAIKMYNNLGFELYKLPKEVRVDDMHFIKYI